MSESIIVELNQRNAEYSKPGEYRCQLSQPVIVNEGDQLSFRMGSIDVQKTSTDTVVIENDTNLSILFSYTDVDYSLRDKLRFDGCGNWLGDQCGNPTYDYFGCYNTVGLDTLTGIQANILGFQFPIGGAGYIGFPGGSFIVGTTGVGSGIDPRVQFIATFSYIDSSGNLKFLQASGNNTMTVDPPQGWKYTAYGVMGQAQTGLPAGKFNLFQLNGQPLSQLNILFRRGSMKICALNGFWPGANLNNDGKFQLAYGPYGSFYPPNGQNGHLYDTEYPFLSNQFSFQVNSTQTGNTGLTLDLQTATAVLKPGTYDPGALAVELTQLFSSANGLVNVNGINEFQPNNPFLTRTDIARNSEMLFRRLDISAGTSNIAFNNQNSYQYDSAYFVGANTFAIEYGKAGMIYQTSYMHTPLSNPARVGEQDLGIFHYNDQNGQLNFAIVTVAGGIVIHDLQPASFWQDILGLRNRLIVPLMVDNSGVQYYDKTNMLNCTTSGFQGLGSFFLEPEQINGVYNDPRKIAPIPPVGNPIFVDITGQSKAILGESPIENTREGFYLIECLNFFRRTGGYLDDKENRISISAIASTQYLSANTVTVFSDAAVPFVHRGESYVITDCTVRILDPVTKQPATGLGPNTCIFLQVDRMLQIDQPIPEKASPQQEHEGVK